MPFGAALEVPCGMYILMQCSKWNTVTVANVLPELLLAFLQVQLLSQRKKADFPELPPNISASSPLVWDAYSQEDLVVIPGKYNIKKISREKLFRNKLLSYKNPNLYGDPMILHST